MSKIKILTITTTGLKFKEGIATVIMDYYTFFSRDKFEIDLVASGSYSNELIKEFEELGLNIRYLPWRKKSIIKYIIGLVGLMKKQRYDILYIHGSSAIMTMELIIAKLCGCKVRVVHSHNTTCKHKRADKMLRPLLYHSYTYALACGQQAGEWLYGHRNFKVVKNGRSIEKYRFDYKTRKAVRELLNISEDTLVVGHVGNFNEQKNQKFLVKAFKELLKLKEDAKLYLIGTGNNIENVKALVNSLNISDKVEFTGSIDNVPEMLQAMDVMVLPSLYEGLPLVVVEWQIAALPCLVADTVTKECSYTELVHFKSLEDGYIEWAKEILKIANVGIMY
jgi:glycosyltransferase involved in cell wall biosynthesis